MAGSASVRNIVVRIGADVSDLQKSLNKAQTQLKGFGSNLSTIGKSMATAITVPVVGLGVAALKTAADFEQGMADIKAVSGATGAEMKKLQGLALKMGADTKFSATEAAKGIEELSKAGLTTEQILNGGLKGALTLAVAGELELGEAAEIASTALNAFKKDGLSMAQAADILAGAANASATDVRELKFGLSMVGAVASSVGMSFKDTNTALAVFAQNGLKGSDAGTSLKTMLLNLQPSTDKAAAAMKKLGLLTDKGESKFFNAKGQLKSLREISDLLSDSMSGLTDAQRMSAMEIMFGTDAIRAANILYSEGEKGITGMAEAMGKVSAADVASQKMNTFKGKLEELKGSLETVGINIGTLLLPHLTNLAVRLNTVVDKFSSLPPSTQLTILAIAGVAAAIGPLLMMFGSMATGASALIGVFSTLGTAITGISLPVVAVVAVLAGLTAAFILLWNTDEGFRKNISAGWETMKTTLSSIWEGIKQIAITIWNGLKSFWATWGTDITNILKTVFYGLQSLIQVALNAINGIVNLVLGVLTGDWSRAWEGLKQFAINAIIMANAPILAGLEILKGIFMAAFSYIYGTVLKPVFDWLDQTFSPIFNTIYSIFAPALNSIKNVVTTVFNFAWTLLKGMFTWLVDIFGPVFNTLFGLFAPALKNIYTYIKSYFGWAWEAIKAVFNWLTVTFSPIFKDIWTLLQLYWGGLADTVKDIFDGIQLSIEPVYNWLVGTFAPAFETVKKALNDAWGTLAPIVKGIWDGIANAVKSGINTVIAGINFFLNAVGNLSITLPEVSLPGGGKIGGYTIGMPQIPDLPMLKTGTNYVPNDMIAMLHKGEAVVPEKYNDSSGATVVKVYLDGREVSGVMDRYLGGYQVGLGT